jgi:hypothetical protein
MRTTEHPEHINSADFPEWAWPPFRWSLNRIINESRFLHLSIQGLGHIPNSVEVMEYLRETDTHNVMYANWEAKITMARDDAQWVNKEIEAGFPILHSHSMVALWSILEAFSEDLAVCWLLNKPELWKIPQISKIKIPIGDFETLSPNDRAKTAILELSRSLSVDFKTGAGKLNPVFDVFGLSPRIGENLRRALHELCQVRNNIVHCDGKADKKLLDECPWLEWKAGDRIKINHSIFGWYYQAANRYIERVLSQAMKAIGLEGCNCPGMDEISQRPEIK